MAKTRSSVTYREAEQDYFAKRALRRHAGVWSLWALGVAAVISGDFFGWNFGLEFGFGGLLVATLVITVMYLGLCYSIAEMSPALPHTGGAYSFGRTAMGPWGGFVTGVAESIEYIVTPAVIVVGIGGYMDSITERPLRYVDARTHLVGDLLRALRGAERLRRGGLVPLLGLHLPCRTGDPGGLLGRRRHQARLPGPGHRLRGRLVPRGSQRRLLRHPVRDLVLPGDRGAPPRRGGVARPSARHPARHDLRPVHPDRRGIPHAVPQRRDRPRIEEPQRLRGAVCSTGSRPSSAMARRPRCSR